MKSIDPSNRKPAETEIATASVIGNFIASQQHCRGNILWIYIQRNWSRQCLLIRLLARSRCPT